MNSRETQHQKIREIWAEIARRTAGSAPEPCPDPEILSAYTSQMLSEPEKSRWEMHFSDCAACQETLVALSEAEENTPAPEAIPLTTTAAIPRANTPRPPVTTLPQDDSRRSRWRGSWYWLTPVMAAAVVVAVWFGMRGRRAESYLAPGTSTEIAKNVPPTSPEMHDEKRLDPKAKGTDAAKASGPGIGSDRHESKPDAAESKEPEQTNKISPRMAPRRAPSLKVHRVPPLKFYRRIIPAPRTSTESAEARKRDPNQTSPYDNSAVKSQISSSPGSPQPSPALTSENKNLAQGAGGHLKEQLEEQRSKQKQGGQTQQARPGHQAVASVTPSSTAAENSIRVQQDKLETHPNVSAMSESVVVAAAPPSTRALRAPSSENSTLLAKHTITNKIFAPDTQVLWIVGPAGAIQHSTNGGISLITQTSGVLADLLGGSAPSPTVCWVVGRAGTILLTTDGEHWRKVGAPGDQDWFGVRAIDALHAVIWDKDQHATFSTSDGGKTWTSLP